MIELSGTRIVPLFLFQKKKFLGLKKNEVIIGFEANKAEIEKLIGERF